MVLMCFFFQAEDGIRGAQESRGLGDVYKRQVVFRIGERTRSHDPGQPGNASGADLRHTGGGRQLRVCLLYTSDAADDLLCVDLGGRRVIKKKNTKVA